MSAYERISESDLARWETAGAPAFRSPFRPPARPDRVVTLTAMSGSIPARFLSETLSHSLRAETGGTVLLIHLEPSGAPFSLQAWAAVQPQVNGEFSLGRHVEHTEGGVGVLRLNVSGRQEEAPAIASLVEHCSRHFRYLLLQVAVEISQSLLMECLARSDRAFLFIRPAPEDLQQLDLLLREAPSHPQAGRCQIRTIVCREKGEDQFNELLKQMGDAVHGFVHGCPSVTAAEGLRHWPDRHFNAGIRRLAREVGHCRVGLALSSGGARGLSHIGVIQVFEENGIDVDMVVGCSMGSYIGGVWAYGLDGVVLERLAHEIGHRWGLIELIDPFILPRQGFLRGEKVKQRLKRSIGDVHFSELVRPLRIVATDLATLGRVIFSSGEVAAAVHASSAIPGACIPVCLDGELYIDGGIADPLPVDVLEEMGIERIIAVNTIPTPAYLRTRQNLERERAQRLNRRANKLKMLLNRYLNYFAPGNVLDNILRSFNGAQMRVAEYSCLSADVVLRPLSFDGRWHDFRRPGKYIAIGRREAEERLAEVKALINRKEPSHEIQPIHQSLVPAS